MPRRLFLDMAIVPLAEIGFKLQDLGQNQPYQVAAWLRDKLAHEGVEVVPGLDSVGVYGDVPISELEALASMIKSSVLPPSEVKLLEVPVCFELGMDYFGLLESTGLAPERIEAIFCAATYTCEALGFQPGFPYLSGLPAELSGLPRRASPRPSVPTGSIGITGSYCGIYPSQVPGGWNLIGRTPLEIANLRDNHFPIEPGDQVRFRPIKVQEFHERSGERL